MSRESVSGADFRDDVHTDGTTGVARSRTGTRIVTIPVDWFDILTEVMDSELPPQAGHDLGRTFASRLLDELSDHPDGGDDFLDRPMAEFAACLDAAFARHGWGRIESDFTDADLGTIQLEWDNPFPERFAADVLAGIFGYFAEESLECRPVGEGRFLVTR